MGMGIKFSRSVHLLSAFWTLGLAVLIFIDVMGRTLFSSPLPGTKEILQNSVVAITFLQLPLAIYTGSMLRTSILADSLPPVFRRLLRTVVALLGVAFLLGIVWSMIPDFMQSFAIGEYEGEGALRVPVWPVKGLLIVMPIFGAFAYLMMIVYDWQGRLINDLAAPGSVTRAGDSE